MEPSGTGKCLHIYMTRASYRTCAAAAMAAWLLAAAQPGAGAAVSSGHALQVSSYAGGTDVDSGLATAIDDAGNLYVAGFTASGDFDTTAGAWQEEAASTGSPHYDGFVVKVDPTGSDVIYATYLGGDDRDEILDLDVDDQGAAYVTGLSFSTDFPTTPGAVDNRTRSAANVFVTKLSADGSALEYSAILGPGTASAIDVDEEGRAFVAGETSSSSYPSTPGAFQPDPRGNGDAFVSQLTADGGGFVYSTFLGGAEIERPGRIGADPTGSVVVAGATYSDDFPVTPNALQRQPADNPRFVGDAFVTKLAPGGASAVYSTYLGGSDAEAGASAVLDADGNAYVAGGTQSHDFPTTRRAFQPDKKSRRRGDDGFAVKLDPGGDLVYSTYLGGSASDSAVGVTATPDGSSYVAGSTRSADFPTTRGALKRKVGPNVDAFVTRLDRRGRALDYSTTFGGWEQYENGHDVYAAGRRVALAGITYGPELPLANEPFQREYAGNAEAFVAAFSTERAASTDLVADGFEDRRLRLALGDTVQWHFKSEAERSVKDGTGLDLFDSGTKGAEFHYAFTFFSAGRFVAVDSATSRRQRIAVPMEAAGDGAGIHLRWATSVREGYVFDVQVKRPGSATFETIHEGTTETESTYAPADDGFYRFRARLRATATGATSGWSPAVAVDV
jgi:hypothetical protein